MFLFSAFPAFFSTARLSFISISEMPDVISFFFSAMFQRSCQQVQRSCCTFTLLWLLALISSH